MFSIPPSRKPIGLVVISDTRDARLLDSVYRIRAQVWSGLVQLPAYLLADGKVQDKCDDYGHHFVAHCGNHVFGAGRISIHESVLDIPDAHVFEKIIDKIEWPIASINRLVVTDEARGHGISRLIDEARISFAKNAGCSGILACWSDVSPAHRVASLFRHGFKEVDPTGEYRVFPGVSAHPLILTLNGGSGLLLGISLS